MKHTLLLITWSLFLCGVSSSATRRTHTAGSPLNDTSDGALLRAETWTGNLTHQWLYHGPLTPIAELDSQGQVVARYVYGSQDHVPDYLVMGETLYRLVTDQPGRVGKRPFVCPPFTTSTTHFGFENQLNYYETHTLTHYLESISLRRFQFSHPSHSHGW